MLKEADIEEMPIKTSDAMEIQALIRLRDAIRYASVKPWGYCLCLNEAQIEMGHAAECKDLREALRMAGVDPGNPEKRCGKHWGNSDGEYGICEKAAGHDGVCWQA